uniref:CCR4-NOT transcription complex subunit 11 n=2 Tax=Macrostomum lignano TaxID=282301 RepID=A0A1I8IFQ7_9PLAT
IFTDEAVNSWKFEIQKYILDSAKLLLQMIVLRLDRDNPYLLELLFLVLNPETKFHIFNGQRSPLLPQPAAAVSPSAAATIAAATAAASAGGPPPVFAVPRENKSPMHWLVDLVNCFGRLGGFQALARRFEQRDTLNVTIIASLLRPFGASAEVLAPSTVSTYFVPLLPVVQGFLNRLSDADLKRESKSDKHDCLSGIVRCLQCLLIRLPDQEETTRNLEELRLKMILRVLQLSSFNGKMKALNELNKAITSVSYYQH